MQNFIDIIRSIEPIASFFDGYYILVIAFAFLSPIIFLKFALIPIRSFFISQNKELGKNLTEKKFFRSLAFIMPPLILNIFLLEDELDNILFSRILGSWLIIAPAFSLGRLISVISDTFRNNKLFKSYPIRNYLQLIKLLLYLVAGVLASCQVLALSPWGILKSGAKFYRL